jgi:hypothetical protein
MKYILTLLALLNSTLSNASVWQANNEWSEKYEIEYSKWVRTSAVHKDLFVSKDSPYYGISADCADAAYAIRAIFSKENSLPFAITNPSGSRSAENAISNNTRAFDNIRDPQKRFVKFINYIGESVGSENLTRLDTYSIKIDSINSSSMFTYKIKGRFGKSIRHVYTIKNVQETGNLDLIYSTQAIKKNKLPMNYRKGKQLVNPPKDVWGFKRFLWPEHIGARTSTYPESYKYSKEQFSLAKELGADKFFAMVKKTLQTSVETPDAIIERSLENLCLEAQARITNVAQGVSYNRQINGRCMNYREYDTFSTPARDKALRATFELLAKNFNEYQSQITDPSVEVLAQDILFNDNRDLEALNSFCPIVVNEDIQLNLSDLWSRIQSGKLSSHPNDSLTRRWGESSETTNCKVWY